MTKRKNGTNEDIFRKAGRRDLAQFIFNLVMYDYPLYDEYNKLACMGYDEQSMIDYTEEWLQKEYDGLCHEVAE